MPSWGSRLPRWVALLCAGLVLVGMSWGAGAPQAHAADDGKLVLVLDSSGSMKERVGGRSKISIAKSSLKTVVQRLPATAPVGLRVYGATVFDKSQAGACTDSQLVVPIGTGNRAKLLAEIASYQPYGETPISYSLQQAAGDLGEQGRRTILLVSDGEETCKADPCKTAEAITKKNINVKIDVVGLAVSGKVRSQLQCVAKRGKGTYYDADSAKDLEDSLDKLATRALRPFRLNGTPIEGATKQSKAPLVQPGQYLDNIPGNAAKVFYRLPRTARGSTLHVGFTARPTGDAGWVAGIHLRIYDTSGRECGWGYGSSIGAGSGDPLLAAEVSSWRAEDDSGCNTDSELTASVESGLKALGGVKFELLVSEEPPVTTVRKLPAVDTEFTWSKMAPAKPARKPPLAGSSLSDAPVLAPGTYASTILTNETQVYAVNADWGQRVQVEAIIKPRRGKLARELGVNESLTVQLLGPMRGRYVNLKAVKQPKSTITLMNTSETYRVADTTPTIAYLNRSQSPVSAAAIPGRQYVALNMAAQKDKRFLVPYTLVVTVVGTAGAGKPDYVVPATPTPSPPASTPPVSTPPVSTPPPATSSATPSTNGGSSGGGLSPIALVAAAAGCIGIGAAATALLGRRRARRRPTG
ncbi:MAG: VWA domain-containing protein [Propionibacteriaceae bacterium]